MKTILGALATLAGLAFAQSACAGLFSVTPVRVFMAPKDRATAITIVNEGDDELVMQADVYVWRQKDGGEDDLELSEDLILSPPIVKLAPKSRQVVRLAMVRPPASPRQELTYRMLVREIPEAKPAGKNVQLQIALAFSLPVFITPPGARRQLECGLERSAPDSVRVMCENRGSAYAQPREFILATSAGEKLATRDSGGYILPGVKRTFDVKRAEGALAAGKAKLVVNLDDGTSQTFDVAVPD